MAVRGQGGRRFRRDLAGAVIGQGCEDFRGTWKGDVLTLASKGPMGHARLTYDLSKPGVMSSLMETSQDGAKWTKMFDGTYKRKD